MEAKVCYGRISTAFSNLLVRIVSRFNILLRGCGICIDLKFSEAISRSCVLCSFEGKGARGNLVATWKQPAVGRPTRRPVGPANGLELGWGSFISRLLGSNISEAVKGVEIYHVTNMPTE